METRIRILEPEDAAAYLRIRLRALREHPEAFATAYEEEAERTVEEIASRVTPGPEHVTVGVFHDDRLVGIATLVRPTKIKLRHRATLAAMYVAPEARGERLGRTLLEHVLKVATEWEGVSEISLAVTVGNVAARNLYARFGFTSYGTEPRSLCVDGRFHDVEWMNLQLR